MAGILPTTYDNGGGIGGLLGNLFNSMATAGTIGFGPAAMQQRFLQQLQQDPQFSQLSLPQQMDILNNPQALNAYSTGTTVSDVNGNSYNYNPYTQQFKPIYSLPVAPKEAGKYEFGNGISVPGVTVGSSGPFAAYPQGMTGNPAAPQNGAPVAPQNSVPQIRPPSTPGQQPQQPGQAPQIGGPMGQMIQLGNQVAADREVQKQNIDAGQKQYQGIQAQSAQYERDLKPYLDVSRSIVNDPRFYSGAGGELALDLNRVRAAMGNKNAAMLQEALQKVTAASVLGQINNQRAQLEEAGGNSSRIFSQQVQLVEKAAPALANTPAGNRFLIEVSSRMGNLASEVAQMARQYKQQHGYLDTGFDQKLADYMKQNPVFNQQEMSDPSILGAPTVPATYARSQPMFSRWATGMGIKSGDPIRLPNGSIKAAP